MNKEQFAELLNGRQYREEMSDEEHKLAKENGLLVCFGASDDLLELRGIVYDEVGAWDGGSAFLVKKRGGKIDVLSEDDFKEVKELMDDKDLEFSLPKVKIEAEWSPTELEGCSWLIKSDLPHSTFDIMEDGELYCRGLIIERSVIEQRLS